MCVCVCMPVLDPFKGPPKGVEPTTCLRHLNMDRNATSSTTATAAPAEPGSRGRHVLL